MMDRYKIRHRTQGWIACLTWSPERAAKWLAEFDPRFYTDKALQRTDFVVIDQTTGQEVSVCIPK